jgi:hypothetical protein
MFRQTLRRIEKSGPGTSASSELKRILMDRIEELEALESLIQPRCFVSRSVHGKQLES